MDAFDRRRFLGGVALAAGVLSGCIGDGGDGNGGMDGDGTASPDGDSADGLGGENVDDAVASAVDGTTIDYTAITDGAGSVVDDGRRIEYEDPSATFVVERRYDGGMASDDELRVGRDLSGDVPAAFLAPVYDDELSVHVFANDTFVDHADWQVIRVDDSGPVDERPASFSAVRDGIAHLSATSESDRHGIAVVDATIAEIDETDEETLTGVMLRHGEGPGGGESGGTEPPQISFDFERSGDTLRITHQAGDIVDADTLVVNVGSKRAEDAFDGEEVAAGDGATVDLSAYPDARTVRVVWEGEGQSATLASHDV